MAIIKRIAVLNRAKILFTFAHKFPVFYARVHSFEKKKKVGRVFSLSIDLQDISELDRDVVIASVQRREKDCLCLKVALRVFAAVAAIRIRSFLIRFRY